MLKFASLKRNDISNEIFAIEKIFNVPQTIMQAIKSGNNNKKYSANNGSVLRHPQRGVKSAKFHNYYQDSAIAKKKLQNISIHLKKILIIDNLHRPPEHSLTKG